jgi:hypothetical protein
MKIQKDVVARKMANNFYGCFGGYGIMRENYIICGALLILGVVALILFITWLIKDIQK